LNATEFNTLYWIGCSYTSYQVYLFNFCLSFEERSTCLDSVIKNHVDKTMFENFAADVFAPVLPPNSSSKSTILPWMIIQNLVIIVIIEQY